MKRRFNYTGLCVPEQHYMVDISPKIAQIREMVDQGLYFTINRARQYGKTTTLLALRRALAADYLVISISFEGVGDAVFDDEAQFCKMFMSEIQFRLERSRLVDDMDYIKKWVDPEVTDIPLLRKHLDKVCAGRRIVLMIDEVDASTNYRVYIRFLAMLRDKYLVRNSGDECTFHSVILAGVSDIRNIKKKMIKAGVYTPHDGESTVYNSPWNIAADFKVDMSFHPDEIATMLADYENDHHTGMDIAAVSRELYHWTDGYPYLVSKLCYHIAAESQPMRNPLPWPEKPWSKEGVFHAMRIMLWEQNTLFDDIFKNMELDKELYDFIYGILILGTKPAYSPYDPVQNTALMYAFVKQEGDTIVISNRMFELLITRYLSTKEARQNDRPRLSGVLREDVVKDGRFDMELALRKFAVYFREVYTEREKDFFEKHGRLFFLIYLSPLVNGGGFYHIESQFTDLQRMDVVVDYGREQFVVELKLWRGEAAREGGLEQLTGYLKAKGLSTGYMVTFDLRSPERRVPKEEWGEADGCRVFEVVL